MTTSVNNNIDDYKGFYKARENAFPLCPAKWLLFSKNRKMCRECPFRGKEEVVMAGCGLPYRTVDHHHQVVEKDGKTRHYIAYPYDLHLHDLEKIVEMCHAHPGMDVHVSYEPGTHGTAMRLDFFLKNY